MKLDVYFGKTHIEDLVTLAQNIYLYQDQAYSLVMSSEFQEQLKVEEPFLYPQFISCLSIPKDEVFLFKISYLFCPYMTFRYRGYLFNELKELGEKIILFGPDVDVYLEDILKYKLLSFYYKIQGRDKKKKKEYQEICQLEKDYESNSSFAYFTLGFKLSGITAIIYRGRPFVSPELFFTFMTNDANITEFAMTFEKNQYVFAWLTYLGYKEKLQEYYSLVKVITDKENLENDRRNKLPKMVERK